MRSWVRCGIDFAAGERLITRDTVARESPRCSATNFKLTDGAEASPRGREDATVFDRGMECFVRVVWHKREARASGNAKFFATAGNETNGILGISNRRKSDLSETSPRPRYSGISPPFRLT